MAQMFKSFALQRQVTGSDVESDCGSNGHVNAENVQETQVSQKSAGKPTTTQALKRALSFRRQVTESDVGRDCRTKDHVTADIGQATQVSRTNTGKLTTTQALKRALSFRRQVSDSDVGSDCRSNDQGTRKQTTAQAIKNGLSAFFSGRQQEQRDAVRSSNNQRWVLPSDPASYTKYDLFRKEFISLPQLNACVKEYVEKLDRRESISGDSLRKMLTKLCDSLLHESWRVAENIFRDELGEIRELEGKLLESESMRMEALSSCMKEVTACRDELLSSCGGPNARADLPDVTFFDPLLFLDEATRGVVHAVVEDQLKTVVSEVEDGKNNALSNLLCSKMEMYRDRIAHEEQLRAESSVESESKQIIMEFEQRLAKLQNDMTMLDKTRREEQETMLEQLRSKEQQVCALQAEMKPDIDKGQTNLTRSKLENHDLLDQLPTANQAIANTKSLNMEQALDDHIKLDQLPIANQAIANTKSLNMEKALDHHIKLEQLPTANRAIRSRPQAQIHMKEALDDQVKHILTQIRAAEWTILPGTPSSTLLKQATSLHDVFEGDHLQNFGSDIDLLIALANMGDQVAREVCEEVNSTLAQETCEVSSSVIELLYLQFTVARRQAVMFVVLSSHLIKAVCNFFDLVHRSGLPPGKQLLILKHLQEARRESKRHTSACFWTAQSSFEQIEEARRQLKSGGKFLKESRQQEKLEEEGSKRSYCSGDATGSQLESDGNLLKEARQQEKFKEEESKPSYASEDATRSQLESDGKLLKEAGNQEKVEEEGPKHSYSSKDTTGSQTNQADLAWDATQPALTKVLNTYKQRTGTGKAARTPRGPSSKTPLGKSDALPEKNAQAARCSTDIDAFSAMSQDDQSRWSASADQPPKPSSKSQSTSASSSFGESAMPSSMSNPNSNGKYQYYIGPSSEVSMPGLPAAKPAQMTRRTSSAHSNLVPRQSSCSAAGRDQPGNRGSNDFLGLPASSSLMKSKSSTDLNHKNSN